MSRLTSEILNEYFPEGFLEKRLDRTKSVTKTDIYALFGMGRITNGERKAHFIEMFLPAIERLRTDGLLGPVKNAGARQISVADTWNDYVSGGTDALTEWQLYDLAVSPLVNNCQMAALNALWPIFKDTDDQAVIDDTSKIDAAISVAETAVRTTFGAGNSGSLFPFSEPTCRLTGERMHWGNDLYAPSLCRMVKGELVEVEILDKPKSVRHVVANMPSGVLVAADWFRIPGFNEAAEPWNKDYRDYDIGCHEGLDLRTRKTFEELGLFRIHVGNSSPQIIADGDILRFGYLDEDHEDYPEEGDPELTVHGRVTTDLWDVTFADREVVIDVLFAGGQFEDRAGAAAALDDYIKQWHLPSINIGPGELHIYMPTGNEAENFHRNFSSADIRSEEWIEDMFILSRTPLAVDPDVVEENDWVYSERYMPTAQKP